MQSSELGSPQNESLAISGWKGRERTRRNSEPPSPASTRGLGNLEGWCSRRRGPSSSWLLTLNAKRLLSGGNRQVWMCSDGKDKASLVWMAEPAFSENHSLGKTGSPVTGPSIRPSAPLTLGLVALGTGIAWHPVQPCAHIGTKQVFVKLPFGSQT